jgi:hypothetical protein
VHLISWCASCRVCNLQARAPNYAGQCIPGTAFDTNPKNSTEPYTCKSPALNTTNIPTGNACTVQIDHQLDCDSLCVCTADVQGTTSPTQCSLNSDTGSSYCRCQACLDILPVDQEEGFQTIRDIAIQASTPTNGRRLQHRKLQQVRNERHPHNILFAHTWCGNDTSNRP